MFKTNIVFTLLYFSLFSLFSMAKPIDKSDLAQLNGSWHLRAMDGKDVRKARAILDFHAKEMLVNGFDGCNRISGYLKQNEAQMFNTKLLSTKMACRKNIHRYVSKRLHETVEAFFSITQEKRYGIEGITIKSKAHDLFFKRMEKE